MIRLSGRLRALYESIPECDTLCDCGCDHGKIIVKAVAEGKCRLGIAVDISAPSLEKAKKLAAEYGADDKMVFSVSDGLRGIHTVLDVVIIAGMGAPEIINVLSSSPLKHKTLILMPHNYPNRLRAFLNETGYYSSVDRIIEDGGRFYNLIIAGENAKAYDETSIYLGFNDDADQVFEKYVKKRSEQLRDFVAVTTDEDIKKEYSILKGKRGLK